ncbi:hypothetical protein VMCG_08202 [Cytospora schulzeri]|uniref:Uncharacterized protein n=1 Tax=Cytospora schulzeri TaxID=448051 RepID=A0A423VUA6_9PEZI|nr:hypothetical protein VMCG_08202 [Valsa malicola]
MSLLFAHINTGPSYPSQKPPTELKDGTDLTRILGTGGHKLKSGTDGPNGNSSGEGRDSDGTPDAGGVQDASGRQASRGSASSRLRENTGLEVDQNADTTTRGNLIKTEDVSDVSSCSSGPPSKESSQSKNPVDKALPARSPSAAAAATGIAHEPLEATQALAGKEQNDGSLAQEPSTDQAVSGSRKIPVATPIENSRKRSFDGGDLQQDAGMSKRRRSSHGEQVCEKEESVADSQPSEVHQPEVAKQSGSESNGSGLPANKSRNGVSGVHGNMPSKAGPQSQTAGPSHAPSTARRVSRRQTHEASDPPVVSELEGYARLIMATPHRRSPRPPSTFSKRSTDTQRLPETPSVQYSGYRVALGLPLAGLRGRLQVSGANGETFRRSFRGYIAKLPEVLNHRQAKHHQDCLLQDEGDGTFSVVATQKRSAERNVPLVVSRKVPEIAPQSSTSASTLPGVAATVAPAAQRQQLQANASGVSSSKPAVSGPPSELADVAAISCLFKSFSPDSYSPKLTLANIASGGSVSSSSPITAGPNPSTTTIPTQCFHTYYIPDAKLYCSNHNGSNKPSTQAVASLFFNYASPELGIDWEFIVSTHVAAVTQQTVNLEPWEKAPGRIQSTTSESLDNIAFSRSYLRASAAQAPAMGARVCEEASFFARALRPGTTWTFDRNEGVKRLVAVALGKLHVQIDGEPIFLLATHGLFKVKPGVGCVVANETNLTVVIHVTSLMMDV